MSIIVLKIMLVAIMILGMHGPNYKRGAPPEWDNAGHLRLRVPLKQTPLPT